MISRLYEKVNYLQGLTFLKNCNIHEYDISKANISMLREANVLKDKDYHHLYRADRRVRQVTVGLLIKDNPELYPIIKAGIQDAKRKLFEKYNIEDSDVLSIKNDAVYLLKNINTPEVQVSDFVKFTLRNTYTSFYRIYRQELYYLYDVMTEKEVLDIKGMNDFDYEQHEHYMIDFLKELFKTFQLEGAEKALELLNIFYYNYMNKNLNIGYYRNMESGTYTLTLPFTYVCVDSKVSDPHIFDKISIENNAAFLRELAKIYYTEYFKGK